MNITDTEHINKHLPDHLLFSKKISDLHYNIQFSSPSEYPISQQQDSHSTIMVSERSIVNMRLKI